MDPRRPEADAVGVVGGRVVAVGSRGEARAACPAGASVLDLPGTIVPGLIDSHVHLLWDGQDRERLDLSAARSVDEMLKLIADRAASLAESAWLEGTINVDLERLAEGRLPTAQELDRAAGGRPVFLDRRSHDAVVSTRALALAGIGAQAADPDGGRIERDPGTGEPTGTLIERPAVELVTRRMPQPTEADRRRWLRAVQPDYHSVGITAVADPALTRDELAAYQAAWAASELSVRTMAMPLGDTSRPLEEALSALSGLGLRTGFGDDRLWLGPIKLFLDGGGSLGTALLRDPWPGRDDRGEQVTSTEALEAFARHAAATGWGLGVHAVGEAAIDLLLDVFARVADEERPLHGLGFTLIHGYLWPTPAHAARCRELGVLVATQPPLQWAFGPTLAAQLGREATARAHPMRTWLDAGVVVGGGSDGPGIPLSPQWGMWQARTRAIDGDDSGLGHDQALTAAEALALYTTGAAAVLLASGRQGVLQPGALADLAALEVDPLTAPPAAQRDAGVHTTLVGGELVHDAR